MSASAPPRTAPAITEKAKTRGTFGRAGVTAGRLWVFAANSPSIAFYTAHGWAPDGSTRVEAEFGEPEIGLAKAWPAP